MENQDQNWPFQRVSAPDGLFEKVQKRIARERVRTVRRRQRLAVGAGLLLLFTAANAVLLTSKSEPPKASIDASDGASAALFDAYFSNSSPF